MKLVAFIVLFVLSLNLHSKGVKAGTVITNQASLSFSVGNSNKFSIVSNVVESKVSQVLDLILKWQDIEPVKIYEGAEKKVLTFSLVNQGNGKDDIKLQKKITDLSIVKDMEIYIDTNKNGSFDSSDKKIDRLNLEADEKREVFIVTSAKDSFAVNKKLLNVILSAKSTIGGSGIRGKVYPHKGIDGVDAIDGINGGIYSDIGKYEIVTQNTLFKKSVKFFERYNYYLVTLDINFEGSKANLKNIKISDDIPKNLYYRKNSIRVNKEYQTDKKDNDLANFDFRRRRLYVSFSSLKVPKRVSITYILDKEVR